MSSFQMQKIKRLHSVLNDRMCVISLGINGALPPDHPAPAFQDFGRGIERIRRDLIATGFGGDFLAWDRTYPVSFPPPAFNAHYAFKPFCFSEAASFGYTSVLWLDSSIKLKRPLAPLFELIRTEGYLMFKENHSLGEFCKDEALAPLGISRSESFEMPCCWACVLGLNLGNDRSVEFLRRWKELALDGITFPGPKWSGIKGWPRTASADPRVKGHRHDQTAASAIALKLGMSDWKSKQFFREYFDNERSYVRQS